MKPKYILMLIVVIIWFVSAIMIIFYGEGRIKPLYVVAFSVIGGWVFVSCANNLIRNRKELFRKK